MAEALLRSRSRGRVEVESAGTEKTLVRPLALQVLQEIGIDASAQTSKTLDRFLDQSFDFVITVCDAANDACPTFPNAARREHWSLPDPSKATGSEEQQRAVYREVRDDLEVRIDELAAKEELAAIRPELDGVEVMRHLGVEPGPVVGKALAFLLEIRLEEGLLGEAEARRRLDEWWTTQR